MPHGVTLGLLASRVLAVLVNVDLFQKVWLFRLDYIVLPATAGLLLAGTECALVWRDKLRQARSDLELGLQEAPVATREGDRLQHGRYVDMLTVTASHQPRRVRNSHRTLRSERFREDVNTEHAPH
jgi:hypothetical protein